MLSCCICLASPKSCSFLVIVSCRRIVDSVISKPSSITMDTLSKWLAKQPDTCKLTEERECLEGEREFRAVISGDHDAASCCTVMRGGRAGGRKSYLVATQCPWRGGAAPVQVMLCDGHADPRTSPLAVVPSSSGRSSHCLSSFQ
ncbi:hypothetical protein RJT34_11951 [Clitoria ternatea]|uniref:Uncharacterized protein n=1 Tax=Clitoria ternatea TaxID=43366 RepID=A0AAN9JMT1_CLITE